MGRTGNMIEDFMRQIYDPLENSAYFGDGDADIGKTFGPLPDRRTDNHMENPSFTGPPKL